MRNVVLELCEELTGALYTFEEASRNKVTLYYMFSKRGMHVFNLRVAPVLYSSHCPHQIYSMRYEAPLEIGPRRRNKWTLIASAQSHLSQLFFAETLQVGSLGQNSILVNLH